MAQLCVSLDRSCVTHEYTVLCGGVWFLWFPDTSAVSAGCGMLGLSGLFGTIEACDTPANDRERSCRHVRLPPWPVLPRWAVP